MTTLEAFALGIMVALTPSMVVLAWMLGRPRPSGVRCGISGLT